MRGFIRLRNVVFLVLLGALGIAVVAYGRMALAYYRIKQEAIQLANNEIIAPEAEIASIDRFLFDVHERTELTLTRSDVVVKRNKATEDTLVEVHAVLPITFPVVNRTHYRLFIISVQAQRIKSY